ncbi:MAG TPA: hypothetical protein VGO81_14305 [Solirubrobacteraceae bacterium]|nr:hypothetical protein [Solirubrobacteraceae bacterium]
MSVGPEQDAPRTPAAPDAAFRDAVTFAFGDPVAELYGHARIGLGADGASGVAVLFAGAEIVSAATEGGVAVEGEGWEPVRVAGLRTSVEEPLQAWTLSYERDGAGFDLRFEARSAPAVLAADSDLARTGGMEGYEQLCSVTGSVRHGGREQQVRCLGQRGHIWGAPDWKRLGLARTLSAWVGADRAVMLSAARPARARGHGEEAVAAWLVDGGEPHPIKEPRLSTTYDADLRQQRAGLELWMDEESEYARRASGEVLCGTTIDLGDVRLDTAFFGWRMEGREGVGRYDVMRRAGRGSSRRR